MYRLIKTRTFAFTANTNNITTAVDTFLDSYTANCVQRLSIFNSFIHIIARVIIDCEGVIRRPDFYRQDCK